MMYDCSNYKCTLPNNYSLNVTMPVEYYMNFRTLMGQLSGTCKYASLLWDV